MFLTPCSLSCLNSSEPISESYPKHYDTRKCLPSHSMGPVGRLTPIVSASRSPKEGSRTTSLSFSTWEKESKK